MLVILHIFRNNTIDIMTLWSYWSLHHLYYDYLSYRYKVEKFPVERQYRVNLKVQICFNSTSVCEIEMDAFTDAMIPWRQCAWNLTYSTAGKLTYIFCAFDLSYQGRLW